VHIGFPGFDRFPLCISHLLKLGSAHRAGKIAIGLTALVICGSTGGPAVADDCGPDQFLTFAPKPSLPETAVTDSARQSPIPETRSEEAVASIKPTPQDNSAGRAEKTEQAALAEPPSATNLAPPPPSRNHYILAVSRQAGGSEPASRDPSLQDTAAKSSVARNLAVFDIQQKIYSLAGLEHGASLSVYGSHDENSPVLGSIPESAKDVEATGLCVEKWCLVRRGSLRGWIQRRHLVDEVRAAGSRSFRFSGPGPWSVLEVYDYPREGAKVVGQIASPAKTIEPVGDCGKDWCHIRYFNLAGWVRTNQLELQ
jgi:SH3-like domain-containing protein